MRLSAKDKNKAAVDIVKSIAADGEELWTRFDMYSYAHGNGGSRVTFTALSHAQDRGWVNHLPRLNGRPECWTLTDLGRKRANR